jgi:hypothetical protein
MLYLLLEYLSTTNGLKIRRHLRVVASMSKVLPALGTSASDYSPSTEGSFAGEKAVSPLSDALGGLVFVSHLGKAKLLERRENWRLGPDWRNKAR